LDNEEKTYLLVERQYNKVGYRNNRKSQYKKPLLKDSIGRNGGKSQIRTKQKSHHMKIKQFKQQLQGKSMKNLRLG